MEYSVHCFDHLANIALGQFNWHFNTVAYVFHYFSTLDLSTSLDYLPLTKSEYFSNFRAFRE